jgi:hypothetical protein
MVLDIELDTKIGPACSLDIKVSPKLCSALDNKLKCRAKVITVITNIMNSFGAEIGAVLVSKLGSILEIALRTELGTALRELCTIVNIKLEDNVKLGSKLETILGVKMKLGSKVGTVLDRELCTVAVDIKLGSKLGTVLDRGCRTVVSNIKLGSELGTGLDRGRRAVVYKLLFKSCRFAPQCLRKTRSQQSTRLLFYVIVLITLVRLQICPL